ncbi:MAG: SDR family NAD(P)-dependent oxidoreductase [Niabella sp.]
MQQTVFITGATSGFGEACAIKFAENNYNVIITGRRKDRLDGLSERLQLKYHIRALPLPFDVGNREAVQVSINSLPATWKHIDVLINNAGLAAGRDDFEEASLDDWDTMIDTNLKGLAYVTKAVLPLLIKAKKGHIINVSSTAGKEVYAQGNMYCATKHAVTALSESMRIDLLKHNIKVTAIHPGAAATAFSNVRFKGDAEKAAKVYEGINPLKAADVADIIYYCAGLPEHVCINDLVVTCTQQANSFYSFKSQ